MAGKLAALAALLGGTAVAQQPYRQPAPPPYSGQPVSGAVPMPNRGTAGPPAGFFRCKRGAQPCRAGDVAPQFSQLDR